MLAKEKEGAGHVEFEESDSGKHKIARLIAGPDLEKERSKKESIFGLTIPRSNSKDKGDRDRDTSSNSKAAKGKDDGNVNAKRDNSTSSIAPLAFAIVSGRNNSSASLTGSSSNIKVDYTSDGSSSNIKANRMLSESVYRSKQTIGEDYMLNNDLIVKFRQVFHGT